MIVIPGKSGKHQRYGRNWLRGLFSVAVVAYHGMFIKYCRIPAFIEDIYHSLKRFLLKVINVAHGDFIGETSVNEVRHGRIIRQSGQ